MIPFLAVEISIILSGFTILSGHLGIANQFLIGTFFLIFFAVLVYLIRLFNSEKK